MNVDNIGNSKDEMYIQPDSLYGRLLVIQMMGLKPNRIISRYYITHRMV